MIIAAHQPNYLPWLGFFDKLRRSDAFLILDHCQFERQGFQNRTKVRFGNSWRWLSVPVVQKSRDELILDKEIADDRARDGRFGWGHKQFVALAQAYRGTPHFARYAPALRDILNARWAKLVDLNLALLSVCMEALEIRTPLRRTSQMGPLPGHKSELVLNMCKAAGAVVYLSGDGASKSYLDIPAFQAEGISVWFQDFKHPDYPQGELTTVHGLTVLDLLFNCGPESRAVLEGKAAPAAPLPSGPEIGAILVESPGLPPVTIRPQGWPTSGSDEPMTESP